MEPDQPAMDLNKLVEVIRHDAAVRKAASEPRTAAPLTDMTYRDMRDSMQDMIREVETFSVPPTELPGGLNRFPLTIGPIKKIFLALYKAMFGRQLVLAHWTYHYLKRLGECLDYVAATTVAVRPAAEEADVRHRLLKEQLNLIDATLRGQGESNQRDLGEVARRLDAAERELAGQNFQLRSELNQMRALLVAALPRTGPANPATPPASTPFEPMLAAATTSLTHKDAGEEARALCLLEKLRTLLAGIRQPAILDVRSGGGAWIEKLTALPAQARGVESNPALAHEAGRKGLPVAAAPVLAHLESQPEASLDAILVHDFGAMESATEICAWLARIQIILKPGGVLALRSPNPRNLLVATGDFYRTPGHLRPLPVETAAALAQAAGLGQVECFFYQPQGASCSLDPAAAWRWETPGDLLRVSPEYVVLARK